MDEMLTGQALVSLLPPEMHFDLGRWGCRNVHMGYFQSFLRQESCQVPGTLPVPACPHEPLAVLQVASLGSRLLACYCPLSPALPSQQTSEGFPGEPLPLCLHSFSVLSSLPGKFSTSLSLYLSHDTHFFFTLN